MVKQGDPGPIVKYVKKPKRTPEQEKAVRLLHKLTLQQRLMIEALLHSASRREALGKMEAAGYPTHKSRLSRWEKQPEFSKAWKAQELALAALVTKSSVILNAQNILATAMEDQPIVSRKTGEVVGYKQELGHALSANEQLGKAVGAFGQNNEGKTIVVIDIDFSGRKSVPVQEHVVDAHGEKILEGDWSEAPSEPVESITEPRPTGSGLVITDYDPAPDAATVSFAERPSWLE